MEILTQKCLSLAKKEYFKVLFIASVLFLIALTYYATKQSWAELGQAQLKLVLKFIYLFYLEIFHLARMDKCRLDICFLNKWHPDSVHLLKKGTGTNL